MEKQNKIPILRFPQFKKEWEIQKVGNLTNRISNPVKVEHEELYQQIGIRSHGKGIFHKELIDGKGLGDKRVFWVKENTFIVNIVFAWEQAVAKTTSKEVGMIASHRFPMYEPIENKSNLEYLLYFFLTKKGKALLELASPGGAGRNKTLGQKEFENLKFLIPPSTEQEKIASFITSINQKIQALKDKKNLLTKYKKGVMQQLFSQALRFKNTEGGDFEDWEVKKLGEVLTIGSGRDYKHLKIGNIPVFGTGGLMTTVDSYLHDGETVCIGRKGTIDKPMYFKGKIWTVDTLFYTHSFNNSVPKFIFYTFQRINWKEHNEASGVPSLSKSTIEKIDIPLPSLEEQTRIANYLSAIDAKIQGVSAQIEKMETWKKGLLQQMFV
jgi:type I restriction enzyme, S subunit